MTPREASEKAQTMVAELKNARINLGRDGTEIAHHAGLQRYVIQTSEAGITNPRLTTLIRWADALKFDVILRARE